MKTSTAIIRVKNRHGEALQNCVIAARYSLSQQTIGIIKVDGTYMPIGSNEHIDSQLFNSILTVTADENDPLKVCVEFDN